MSSSAQTGHSALPALLRMQESDLDEVQMIEDAVYPFPWTRGNFADSITSGYETWILRQASGRMLGYFVMMYAVDESHLLNITVHPDYNAMGYGRLMLDKVRSMGLAAGMKSVLLEVRPSNPRAQAIYLRYGFSRIGIRRNYYPAPDNKREDAIVMRMKL